jgi:hypothetical protein
VNCQADILCLVRYSIPIQVLADVSEACVSGITLVLQSRITKPQDACYHRKVRCDGIEGEICSRCLANDLECHHDGRRKSKITRIDE